MCEPGVTSVAPVWVGGLKAGDREPTALHRPERDNEGCHSALQPLRWIHCLLGVHFLSGTGCPLSLSHREKSYLSSSVNYCKIFQWALARKNFPLAIISIYPSFSFSDISINNFMHFPRIFGKCEISFYKVVLCSQLQNASGVSFQIKVYLLPNPLYRLDTIHWMGLLT